MAYKRSVTSSHPSDDNDSFEGDSVFWPSPAWRRDEEIWAERRRSYQRHPPTPTPTESSHVDEDEVDGLTLSDLEGSVGIWVTPEEARQSRVLVAEQRARIEHVEDQDAASQSLNNKLVERVAELSVQFCMLGLILSRARMTIKVLLLALVVSQVVCVALLFK